MKPGRGKGVNGGAEITRMGSGIVDGPAIVSMLGRIVGGEQGVLNERVSLRMVWAPVGTPPRPHTTGTLGHKINSDQSRCGDDMSSRVQRRSPSGDREPWNRRAEGRSIHSKE
jgi:hypothetical protein